MISRKAKMPDMNERRIVWKNCIADNEPVRNLFHDLLVESIERTDTVKGLTPETLLKKQGTVEGLEMALEILTQKTLPEPT